MKDLLNRYNELQMMITEAQTEIAEIEEAMKRELHGGREFTFGGQRVKLKRGRKRVDHKAAVMECGEDADYITELINKHTKVKTSTLWAAVTKDARIPLDDYTEYGEDEVVVEME